MNPPKKPLFLTNKKAFVDSTLQANKGKEWVQRLYQPNAPTIQIPGEPDRSTHYMGDDGNGYVFPTVVRQPGAPHLSYLGDRAEDYAREMGTGIQFKNREQGDYFGHNGYKEGTGVNNSINSKGVPYNNPSYQAYPMKTKSKPLPKQKAAKGLHEVSVPPPGNSGDVLNSAVQGGLAGSQFGPVAGFLGGLGGLGMGLYQSSQQDAANKVATQRNSFVKANNLVDGYDPTSVQRGQYAQGTEEVDNHKPIEVEKDELVFRKVGDKFRLKADFQQGKPHSQGGEDYLAAEGDVIFPGKQRGKVLAAYQDGNHAKLEGMRVKLPKDTNLQGKAAMGVDGTDPRTGRYTDPFNRNGAYGAASQAFKFGSYLQPNDPSNPYPGEGVMAYQPQGQPKPSYYLAPKGNPVPASTSGGSVGFTNRYAPDSPYLTLSAPNLTLPSFNSPGSSTGQETGLPEQGVGLGNALKYASVANNLIQGFSSPEKVQESYLDPVLNTYADSSDPQRRQSTMVRNAQFQNARNSSGGMVSNLRSNQQIAAAEDFGRKQEIDNREQGRADDIRASNVGIVNQTNSINSQKRDQYNALNGQVRANQQAYKDAAFGQLASLGNAMEQDAYKKSRDGALDNLEQGKLAYVNKIYDFQTDGKGSDLNWKGPSGGYLGPLNPSSTTVKVDTDIYGRKKPSTSTQTSLGIRRGKRK